MTMTPAELQTKADESLWQEAAEQYVHKRDIVEMVWQVRTLDANSEWQSLLDNYDTAQECQAALDEYIANTDFDESGAYDYQFYAYHEGKMNWEHIYQSVFFIGECNDWRSEECSMLQAVQL